MAIITLIFVKKVGELAWASFEESLELVQMANEPLDRELFLQGKQTPVLFGTALGNFGVDHVLDAFMNWHLNSKAHPTQERVVEAKEEGFSGFVFKIQANMDLNTVTVLPSCVFVQVNTRKA